MDVFYRLERELKALNVLRNGPLATHNYLSNTDSTVIREAARDTVTPGAMIKGNFKSPNPWSYTAQTVNYWHGEKTSVNSGNGSLRSFSIGTFGPNNGIVPSDILSVAPAYTLLYNRALKKLADQVRGDLDLSVDAFQGRQNIQMIQGLRNVLNFARHPSKWAGIRPKDIANGYLEWKYGWKPLAADVFGIANESIRYVLNKVQRFKASVSQPYRVELPVSRTVDGVANCTGVCSSWGRRIVTISVTLNVPSFDLARFATLNPVGIAWELIPYSFVVDWFYDVGSYLHQLETACLYDLRVLNGYVSDLLIMDSSTELVNRTGYVAGADRYTGRFTTDFRYRGFNRTVSTSFPLPRLPSLKVDLSSSQCFSAAALLTQTLGGHGRGGGPIKPTRPGLPSAGLRFPDNFTE